MPVTAAEEKKHFELISPLRGRKAEIKLKKVVSKIGMKIRIR
jgi:hypothetical protein